MEGRRKFFLSTERPGYALLLGLLIVVVIGMVYYYMRMYGAVYQIGEGESDIMPPWRQWQRMQVRLHKSYRRAATAFEATESRGQARAGTAKTGER
ncbi:MAG: hypothetical protein V3W45_04910 [Sedimentisphaerales bacterium]